MPKTWHLFCDHLFAGNVPSGSLVHEYGLRPYPILTLAYILVQTDALGHIANIKLDGWAWLPFWNLEIEPKQMSLRIRVDPQKQVVLFGANLHHAVQVTRLEIRIKG